MGFLKSGEGDKSNDAENKTEQESVADEVHYVARGIANLRIGKFQFQHGRLKVPADEVERFDNLLAAVDPRTRAAVSKIDAAAGEAIAKAFLQQTQGSMTSGVDTTANSPQAPNPQDPNNQPNKA